MSTVRWPADRFYWSVLEAPGWRRVGELPAGLRPLFEEDAPEAGEELHAVCAPIAKDRIVVCAARRSELAGLDAETLTLTPEAFPPCAEATIEPGLLNVLVGAFEPRSMRSARHRHHLVSAAALAVCGVLLGIGLERRAEYHRSLAYEARQARVNLVAQVGPKITADGLRTELAMLRRSSETGQRVRPPEDASIALVEMLQGWPTDVKAEPQTLAVSGSSIGMSVMLEGDPGRFLEVLKMPSGWMLDQPRLNNVGKMTRLDLRFRPAAEGGRP